MNTELLALVQSLLTKPSTTILEISKAHNVTKRQIKYRLAKLNTMLKEEGVDPVISNQGIIMPLSEDTKQALKRMHGESQKGLDYSFSKEERIVYMFLMLFLNRKYIAINDFIDLLDVSKSTVLADFKALIQETNDHDIDIKYNRIKGYYLVGDETTIRRLMMRYVIYSTENGGLTNLFNTFIDDFHLELFDYSKLVINELAQKHHIRFVEDRLIEFIYIFTFLKARIQSDEYERLDNYDLPNIDMIKSTKEYEFAIDLLKNYQGLENIKQADVNYISSWVLGISFGDINDNTPDCVYISDLVGKIMDRFESLSGAHYKNSEEIFIQLYSHFRPAYYRLLFHLPISNPLATRVKEEYKELYQLVAETIKPYAVVFGGDIPDDEIAYLTMHFAAIYSGKKESDIEQKRALVVCSNGIGSSAILYGELKEIFPELYFLPPLESSELKDVKEDYDIIFATRYVEVENTNVPIIRVTPVMNIQERYRLMRDVYLQLKGITQKQPSIDIVLKIIDKYATIHDELSLSQELIAYFTHVDNLSLDDNQLHLYEMVRPEIVSLKTKAKDWHEAIRNSFKPLVDNEYVTQNYVEDTIRVMEAVGPYVVISKHVAMPHTKPETGALAIVMGISVLEKPIKFGSKENDPIKYVFCLSATDNETHLTAMYELMELLNNDDFFKFLDKVDDPKEVQNYIKTAIINHAKEIAKASNEK